MSRIFRLAVKLLSQIAGQYRKFLLRMLYPGLEIDSLSVIEKNCKIVCVDGGKMVIKNSFISEGSYLFADVGANIAITDCFIGRYVHIAAKQSITIGKGCLIAEMVVIRDQDHAAGKSGFNENNYNVAPISIGENAWVASKATILKGVSVGANSVIAASAVVTKHVPANETWGGIPAKFIKGTTSASSI